jgi:hypothetical protein
VTTLPEKEEVAVRLGPGSTPEKRVTDTATEEIWSEVGARKAAKSTG